MLFCPLFRALRPQLSDHSAMRPPLLVLFTLCLAVRLPVYAQDPSSTTTYTDTLFTSTSASLTTSTTAVFNTPYTSPFTTPYVPKPTLSSPLSAITPTSISTPNNLGTFTACCPSYLNLVTLCLGSLSTLPANTTLAAAAGPIYACACAQGNQFISAFLGCYNCLSVQSSGLTSAAVQNACNIIENSQVLPGLALSLENGHISNLTSVMPRATGALLVQIWPGHTPIPTAEATSRMVAWKRIVLAMAVGLLGMHFCVW